MNERSTPKILFTNANIASPSLGLITPGRVGTFAAEAGFDGVEWHPLYWPAGAVLRAANSDDSDLTVASLHQSFRVGVESLGTNIEAGKENANMQARLINGPLGRVIMPEMVASARYMGKVQEGLASGRVPAVYYPLRDAELNRNVLARGGAAENVFQPTDHVARVMHATSLERIAELAVRNGFSEKMFCWDTFHSRRRYGRQEPGVVSKLDDTTMQFLAERTRYVHVALGRSDIGGEDIDSVGELQAVLGGHITGATADILTAVKEAGDLRHVVVEVNSAALAAVGIKHSLAQLAPVYRRIADVTRSFVAA